MAAYHHQHSCVCVVAFGTRGDIVPVVAVLRSLIEQASSGDLAATTEWIFITHECFVHDVKTYLPSTVKVQGISTSPIAMYPSEEDEFRSSAQLDTIFSSLDARGVGAIISNLFALEAWTYALKRSVQHIIIHPSMPSPNIEARDGLLHSFVSDYPKVCRILQSRTQPHAGLQWSDFELWLWSTLTKLDTDISRRIEIYDKALTVLVMCSPMFLGKGLQWTPHARYKLCGAIHDGHLHDRVLLQPGVSNCTGGNMVTAHDSICAVYGSTESVLLHIHEYWGRDTCGTICVDFGSMTHVLIQNGQLQILLPMLHSMCDTWRFVIVCHGHAATIADTMQKAHHKRSLSAPSHTSHTPPKTSPPLPVDHRFILAEHSVQHTALFPKCVAVVHHGGIGTTSACMRAGVPQRKWAFNVCMIGAV